MSGEVVRWHKVNGSEAVAASEYIEMLEGEVQQLQQQLEQSKRSLANGNQLLDFLKTLQPQNLQVGFSGESCS